MASDSIAARRKAYTDGLNEIEPQIRGLEDKINDALSSELRGALQHRLNFLYDRRNKINKAVSEQDKADAAAAVLDTDGFPALPDMEISAELIKEYDGEVSDDQAAREGFTTTAQAETVKLNLGAAQDI